jgi:histidyl-tRNA synthetase
MKSAGLKNYTFKVGHGGVLRGVMNQENLDEKTQNEAMQLMDKTRYDDALRLVEKTDASERFLATLRKLVKLKGDKVSEVIEKMRKSVEDYEEAVAATENLQEILKLVLDSGCKIDISLNAGFARGLEYYTGIIFEVTVPELDKALAGGGRYDRLIELFGGTPTPAVGVAHGIDRIMLALQLQKAVPKVAEEKMVMVIPISEKLKGEALKISRMLRDADIPTEVEVTGRKVAKALEDADRKKMAYAIIVGEKELKEKAVVIRDLEKRKQEIVKIEEIADAIRDKGI